MSDNFENKNLPQKTCRDGFDRNHHMVTPKAEYTGIGWFLVTFGITTKPTKIKYTCRKCGEVIEESSSPEDLDNNT